MTEFRTKLDAAEGVLLRLISSGEIAPGEPLRQTELAERLGMSETPVREALRRLEAQGIVVSKPHQGVRVAEVEPHEMSELYLIRAALEGLAVEKAVANISNDQLTNIERVQSELEAAVTIGATKLLVSLNYEFHTRIYRESGLPRLIKLIDSLWPLFPRDSMWTIPGRAPAILQEHDEILAALRAHDPDRAHQAMRLHMEYGAHALLSYREGESGTNKPGKPPRRRTKKKTETLRASQ